MAITTQTVQFASNGGTAGGYLAVPESGSGPGVVVVQEWWGLDPSIKIMTDRLAEAGFVALAPDLYHGELAAHDEMDKAGHLMTNLPPDRAAKDMSGAVDYLAANSAVTSAKLGVIGFCMGGMLTFLLAAGRGDKIAAAVPFYGFPGPDSEPDWSGLTAVIRGHMAENDDFFGPDAAHALEKKLSDLGKDVQLTVHPGSGHAFMNPMNPLGTHDAELAARCWDEATSFLRAQLG